MGRSSSGRCLLAVDLGTSRARAVVFDLRGKLLGLASADWQPEAPEELAPLGRELDPARTWELVCRLIRRALRDAGVPGSRVAAVSATSQRQGMVFLDAHGVELYAGPNTDLRAFMEGQSIDEAHRDRVYRATGHLPSFLFASAKLLWFRGHRPELFQRVRYVLSLDAWVAYKLSGELAVERSMAGEMGLLEVSRGVWAKGLLSTLGLPSASLLPPLVQAGQPLGRVRKEAAARTGLSSDAAVVAGGPDTQCGLLGMGAVQPGDVGIVAGWSAPVQMALDRYCLDGAFRIWTGRHVLPSAWVLESSAADAGAAYRWAAAALAVGGASDVDAAIDRLAAAAPPGANGALAFLGPRAADMGNLGPRWGGLLFPLLSTAMPVRQADLFRAVLENMAFGVRSNVAQLEQIAGVAPRSISFGGGMARRRTLARILADALGREVRLFRAAEVSALGAAMCAATGAGAYPNLEQASRAMRKPGRSVQANPVATLEYEEHYQRWAAMGKHLESMSGTL